MNMYVRVPGVSVLRVFRPDHFMYLSSEVCSCTQRAVTVEMSVLFIYLFTQRALSQPLEACVMSVSFKTLVVSLAPHVCATVARVEK